MPRLAAFMENVCLIGERKKPRGERGFRGGLAYYLRRRTDNNQAATNTAPSNMPAANDTWAYLSDSHRKNAA